MAAKVVMVAVPTVMGIASIRVYTVSQGPPDGLVTREKLNVYTPLPQSAPAQFVPERPGVVQTGFTTVRERILPIVQAVKGACVSVKTGSVNLYHAGEDVYYYLKDPPPGFLPRFGTVTMAGLVGMFLARKGSRFQRLALPLGLMSGGASVCYPAQTVAVVKVTGKNVYAVGQWSSATVSSLLASISQEPVCEESAASQPQKAEVPNPESAVDKVSEPSSTIPETEVESAEPVSDEPAVAVITEEASSVTLKEISPVQTPTETTTVAHSVPGETDATITSEETHAPVESEEPFDSKQAAEDVSTDTSPAETTPSLEAAAVEASPVEAAAVEASPVEGSPVEPAPVEAAALEASPMEAAPAPVEAAEVKSVSSSVVAPQRASEELEVPVVVESPESEPDAQESADPPQVAAVEETPTPTLTTPPPPPEQQPAAENSKGGSGLKTDPSLMDFGQSSPEDEDLYSTRS